MEERAGDLSNKDDQDKLGESDSMSDFVHIEASEFTEAERDAELLEVVSNEDATDLVQAMRSGDERRSQPFESSVVALIKGAQENWQFRLIRNSALLVIALRLLWRVFDTYRERNRLKEQLRSNNFAIRMMQAELLSVLADRQGLERALLDVADQNHMLRAIISDKWFFL
uniref:Uncharacterized protein n=1 Tax=Hanusia phi TaxID=3032 RepID=A0A7S0HXS0_9CRYP